MKELFPHKNNQYCIFTKLETGNNYVYKVELLIWHDHQIKQFTVLSMSKFNWRKIY